MKKIICGVLVFLGLMTLHGQDSIPVLAKKEIFEKLSVDDKVLIVKNGVNCDGKMYIEHYTILTDSLAYEFGLKYRLADSSFVKVVLKTIYSRATYDMMEREYQRVLQNQEQMRKETLKYLNKQNASEVQQLFRMYKILDL